MNNLVLPYFLTTVWIIFSPFIIKTVPVYDVIFAWHIFHYFYVTSDEKQWNSTANICQNLIRSSLVFPFFMNRFFFPTVVEFFNNWNFQSICTTILLLKIWVSLRLWKNRVLHKSDKLDIRMQIDWEIVLRS